jgi:hypothetical protein
MTYQFQWVLDAIRAGETLPDRWPEGEVEEEEAAEPEYRRWWEQDDSQDAGQTFGGKEACNGR